MNWDFVKLNEEQYNGKISEIDESESRAISGYLSRPATNTKIPTQNSQANFRSSKNNTRNSDSDESDAYDSDEEVGDKKGVLITELGVEDYVDSYLFADLDEKKIEKQKKKIDLSTIDDFANDESWDTDLEDDDEQIDKEIAHDTSGKHLYKKMCETLNIVPCRYFMAHVEDQTLVLKYHQFSADEIRAISKPLWNNSKIEKLFLDGNFIEGQGAKYLSRMLRQNDFITELSLTDNRVGETLEGIEEVSKMIATSKVLRKLNLSGNNFSDKNINVLIDALDKNRGLHEINLSHNNLGEESGKLLGAYISSNDSLEIIDLSWNNFRHKGAKELATGIKENVRLKKCSVAFNGFDTDGGKVLAEVIKHNNSLQDFDVSNTRLTAECAATIANALEVNDSMKRLNLSNNALSTSGTLAIIYGIKLNKSSSIEFLDLSEIPVIKEFTNVLREVIELRPSFACNHGLVISTSNTTSIFYEGNKDQKVDFEKILASLKNKA